MRGDEMAQAAGAASPADAWAGTPRPIDADPCRASPLQPVEQSPPARSDGVDRLAQLYRVQVGPFAIGEASEICGNLKKSGVDCVVHRN
jgi:hypothetical protein